MCTFMFSLIIVSLVYASYQDEDSESYSQLLFNNLNKHLNNIKRQAYKNCDNVPLEQTILNQKYFNPEAIYLNYKKWKPPKDYESFFIWTRLDTKRQSLVFSYLLQNELSLEPPSWLYFYLSSVAQLHALHLQFNDNSNDRAKRRRIVKAIKMPFESNEVFKVNWFKSLGKYQKFTKPFGLYTTKPNYYNDAHVRVIDFAINQQDTSNYLHDYTGHAYVGNYLNDILNNQSFYEYQRPILRLVQQQQQQQQHDSSPLSSFTSQYESIRNDNNWDPLLINQNKPHHNNPNRVWNEFYDRLKWSNYQSLPLTSLDYIDTYKYAKVWWLNETHLRENKQEYSYSLRESSRVFTFVGTDDNLKWSSPYYWCLDASNEWSVALMSPIWATNDFEYKNKLFYSNDKHRFVGLSEIILDYEQVDINQCPGDRDVQVFASTTRCDSTSTTCKPLSGFGLFNGAYECSCANGYTNGQTHDTFIGFKHEMSTFKCIKTHFQTQFPNWLVRQNSRKKRFNLYTNRKRNYEKLRDLLMNTNAYRHECNLNRQRDIIKLGEYDNYDERFVNNLRKHADKVFQAQKVQAIRLAHLISSYLQLQNIDVQLQERLELKRDVDLNEQLIQGELLSILQTQYPIIEAIVAFNSSEFDKQKMYASQKTLNFAINAYKLNLNSEQIIINRTYDNSHLNSEWYRHSSLLPTNDDLFYTSGSDNAFYKFNRYSVEFNLRSSIESLINNKLSIKYYDASTNGKWFGPYFDCKHENTISMSFNVPIIINANSHKCEPIGFVSIVIASDNLKWWKINPCDTSEGLFYNEHKCDYETTKCEFNENDNDDDYEKLNDNLYLSSYKCVCKKNYEFPFKDYTHNYFDGLIIEREYEKRMRGESNVYDKLKCRPIYDGVYANKASFTIDLFTIFYIFFLFFFLHTCIK